jgi:peptidoglycan-associated lipoprotein
MAGNVVYFEFDSSALTEAGRAILDKQVALLKKTGASVRLEGHTDERGTREYNIALGERRANAVRDYMMVNGIPGSRLESISYGEEKPVSYGSSEVSWSQNRRVEIK